MVLDSSAVLKFVVVLDIVMISSWIALRALNRLVNRDNNE